MSSVKSKTLNTLFTHLCLPPSLPNPGQSVEMSRLRNWFLSLSTFMCAWRWSYFKHVKTFFVFTNTNFIKIPLSLHKCTTQSGQFEIIRGAPNIPLYLLVYNQTVILGSTTNKTKAPWHIGPRTCKPSTTRATRAPHWPKGQTINTSKGSSCIKKTVKKGTLSPFGDPSP